MTNIGRLAKATITKIETNIILTASIFLLVISEIFDFSDWHYNQGFFDQFPSENCQAIPPEENFGQAIPPETEKIARYLVLSAQKW